MPIPLPPLAEQRAIAAILTAQGRVLVDCKARLIAAKREQKRWLMRELLTGKRRLAGFSGEWEKYALSKCGTIVTGTTSSILEAKNYVGDYLWVTPIRLLIFSKRFSNVTV